MSTIDSALVERLRPLAVRGILTPGLYRHVYNPGPYAPWYEDIYVSEAHILPEEPSYAFDGPTWYSFVHIDPARYGYGKHSTMFGYGSLKDAGVLPKRPAMIVKATVTCACYGIAIGHGVCLSDIEMVPAVYNCNFLVPLDKAVEVK